MPYGQLSWLGPLPKDPRLRPVGLPDRSNSVSRKFFVSATQTVLVVSLMVRSRGQLKPGFPSPNPRVPQLNWNAPLEGSNASTRWLSVSATYRLAPSTSMPYASLNAPVAGGVPPNV